MGCRREELDFLIRIQLFVHLVQSEHILHIALVVLKHEGHIVQVHPVILQILAQILETFQIFGLTGTLGIRHKDNAIDTTKHELTGAVVINLSGNGIKLESGLKTLNVTQVQGQEVKKQGSITFCSERHHVGTLVLGHFLMNHLKIRGFTT